MANKKKSSSTLKKATGSATIAKELESCRADLADAKVKAGMLDLLPTPVMSIDKDYNVTYMNPAGAGVVGKTREEIIGLKCFDLFKTEHCNTPECRCSQAMEKNGVFTSDTIADPEGMNLPIRYTGAPLKDAEDNILGALEFVLDISKEMEVTDGVLELARAAMDGRLDTRADVENFEGNYQRIMQNVNDTLDAVIGPLNVAAEYVDRISKGDIPEKINDEYKGDFNEIKNNLNQCIDAINGLVSESDMLVEAAVEGRLDTRGDADKFGGDFGKIVKGVNSTLDAVIGPLNVAAEYVDRISKGDIPEKITDEYKGDFNEIKNNLNQCIDAVNGLVTEAGMLAEAGIEGRLDTRGDAEKFGGDFGKIVRGVNDTLDAVIGPLNVAAEYVDRISKGDIPESITDEYKGDFNEIKNNLNQCIDAVNGLVSEAGMLVEAAVEGKLDTRGDADKFGGDFGKIIEGVNQTIGTLVGHINQIPAPFMIIDKNFDIKYMNKAGADAIGTPQEQLIGKKCHDQFKTSDCNTPNCACSKAMASGMSASSETDAHPGGHDLFINYNGVPIQNQSGEIIGALEIVMDQTEVKKAMDDADAKVDFLNNIPTPVMVVDRDFNVRFMNPAGASAVGKTPKECEGQKCFTMFNTDHCNTDNCQVAKAMRENRVCTNDTVAKLPSGELPIRYSGAPLKDAEGNIIGGLEYVLDISKEMEVTEGILDLADAALEGRLDTRAEVEKFEGNYRKIVKNVNDTLDAVISPLNVAAEYVDQISKGDIPEPITDEYKGDFNEIKNNINNMIENLSRFAIDAQTAAAQVSNGSQELSSSAVQMSQGATEQSASVEEVSSSMEEMNSTVAQNADNAKETASIAAKAAVDAQEGGNSVSETVHAMKSIADKISIIQEIAQQTNMLSLNAAIEAARAGEHGKGFAVVAAEVRKLAERSQTAAKEIGQLSSTSVEIAERAGKLIGDIVPGIQKTADLVNEINASSTEQADGIQQVTKAIEQLDSVIQQNASATEEMSSTSEELAGQAAQLQEAAAFFKVQGHKAQRVIGTAVESAPPVRATHRASTVAASTSGPAAPAGSGAQIDMADADDSEFERY